MSETTQRITDTDIYDSHGRRKYLTANERRRFRALAEELPGRERNFCLMLYFTGLRISEALALTPGSLDLGEGVVVIRSLKRRKTGIFRAVPLPLDYLRDLQRVAGAMPPHVRLWPFSRKTGYRIIKRVMEDAGISGPHASPKGLRHGFGIACVQKNIPLPTIAKWMGHSTIKTTAIYLNAVGQEEREFARRIW
jgi:integrase